MRKPDFFIIGAPKSGTTAMARYLGEHPTIFMSDPKEPHFFNTDFANRYATTIEAYLGCFDGAGAEHLAVGEASVMYLYSQEAVGNILRFAPEARFVVMLRNPIDVAYGLHSQALVSFQENIKDFEEAWRLQPGRRMGVALPPGAKEKKSYLYGDLALLGEQMQRLLSQMPAERVCTLWFEDLVGDARAAYETVLRFLRVPSDGRTDFPRHNANRRVKSLWLRDAVSGAMHLKRRLGIDTRLGLLRGLKVRNMHFGERQALSKELRREMALFFRDDVQLLSSLTGRDLSHWGME